MTSEELEILRQFFGAYFHQDWMMDAPGLDHVVQLFIDDQRTSEELTRLARLIEKYAANDMKDVVLERALVTELWCYYMPSADGIAVRVWLRHIANLLLSAA